MVNISKNTLLQFFKFGSVGLLNTGVDFLVVFILSYVFNIYTGPYIIVFNTISFLAATVSSYILNKTFTFKDKSSTSTKQISSFLIVSLIGLILNNSVVYLVTSSIGTNFDISASQLLFTAKLMATGVVLIWNFLGYKFIVFKS